MLILKGPAPNLDIGPSGPRTQKKQDPEPRTPKARSPNPTLRIPKFQGVPKLDFFLSKNACFKGSGAKSGPWAFWTPNPQEARPRTQNSKTRNPEPNPKNSKISRLSKTRFFSFQKMLVLKGPAPNLDPGPSGPRTQKKQVYFSDMCILRCICTWGFQLDACCLLWLAGLVGWPTWQPHLVCAAQALA